MAEALYHPDLGYYTSSIQDVGARGDFSTSATLSPLLGRALAAWILERGATYQDLHVIELGAGNGALAQAIWNALGWWQRRRLTYHLVEISPILRKRQQERLARYRNFHWHHTVAEACASAGRQALLFSNEFVDAFPVQWLRWEGSGWQTIGLRFDPQQGLQEVFRPVEKGLESTALQLSSLQEGQRVEICQSYLDWMADLRSHLNRGSVLTIDYGGSAEQNYARRPLGTLRGFYRQTRIEGPDIYRRIGLQDLTADVNFDDLKARGQSLGFDTVYYGTQGDWLAPWSSPRHGADSRLLDPRGAGQAFKVLEQELT